MYTLACKDLGTPECGFSTRGETAEEAVAQMKDHAKEVHAEKIAGKSDQDLDEMMTTAVKEE